MRIKFGQFFKANTGARMCASRTTHGGIMVPRQTYTFIFHSFLIYPYLNCVWNLHVTICFSPVQLIAYPTKPLFICRWKKSKSFTFTLKRINIYSYWRHYRKYQFCLSRVYVHWGKFNLCWGNARKRKKMPNTSIFH